MNKLARFLVVPIALPIIYFLVVIVIASIAGYKPRAVEQISKFEDDFFLNDTSVYSVLIWNIGYGGLGAEMDFFYDGGKSVRDSENNVRRNIYKITEFLQANDSVDFMLLQEVDLKSKRSYRIDQVDHFNLALAGHFPFFVNNYKVFYVPVPPLKPMGKVNSGLLSFAAHIPAETSRHSFPGNYSWPTRLFMLDRCFLVNRFKMHSGKELLIINTHNSAFDDGSLRLLQTNCLHNFLEEEEDKGNSFVVGGDWNQSPGNFVQAFEDHFFDTLNLSYIENAFLQPGWNWAYDNAVPSNRRVMEPYIKGQTPVTLIDFFLTSSNIEVLSCKGVDMDFRFSDHNPVIISFRLK